LVVGSTVAIVVMSTFAVTGAAPVTSTLASVRRPTFAAPRVVQADRAAAVGPADGGIADVAVGVVREVSDSDSARRISHIGASAL